MLTQPQVPDDVSAEKFIRPFADVLRDVRNGELVDELAEKLVEVVTAVGGTGKKGSLTLKLSIQPSKAWGRVQLADEIKLVVPEQRDEAIFFITAGGSLSRRDPNQPELFGPRPVAPRPDNVDEHGEIREGGTA